VWENLSPAQAQKLSDDVEAFQEEFPQYTVSLQHYDNPEEFMTPFMAGETMFDVALVPPALMGNLWSAEKIAPMSDFFPASFTNDFVGVALAGASQNNELWGLPDTAGFHLLLFYNRDLIDTPPSNTNDLSRLAKKLAGEQSKAEQPQWGLAVNSYDALWVLPWLATDKEWLIHEEGQTTLNTPAMETALTLFSDWHKPVTGISPPTTYEEARQLFVNGDAAMLIDGEWAIGELRRIDKVNWGVAPLPNVGKAGDSQPATPLVLARYWVINRETDGDHALASAAFLEYITKSERQLDWTVQFGLLPTRVSALDDLVIVNDSALRTSVAQMQAGQAVPLGVNADTLLNAMRDPLQGMIDGELTPQEAAELMQANLEEQ
jgi:ABC-type glycerol-3-phosphate transport system substrate-binding protein